MMLPAKRIHLPNIRRPLCILIFFLVVVGFTTGCNSMSSGGPNTEINPSMTNSNISDSMLEVVVASLDHIKAGQPFQVNASLINHSSNDLEISHGPDLFTYSIMDVQGNPIKQQDSILYINQIGYIPTLEVGQQYSENGEGFRSREFYEFIIVEPGSYRVKATAHFSVQVNGTAHELELESKEYEFIVK